jgi:hypothetical protein
MPKKTPQQIARAAAEAAKKTANEAFRAREAESVLNAKRAAEQKWRDNMARLRALRLARDAANGSTK